jgi:hypothetical protein
MPDPHNKKPKDILSELRERLKEVGLQPLMIKIIDGKLALDTKKDFLTLPSKIRDKAFRAVQTKLKRPTLKLVKSIAKYLKEALELEAELDDSKGGPATASRPPPGGPRGIWTEFPSDLQPQESSGVGVSFFLNPLYLSSCSYDIRLTPYSRRQPKNFSPITRTSSARI